ncbi:MAG: hypothetical protein IKV62_10260 [Bacteroidales bacterium]|nr:hypothetical protein [Bacteroidales bacterium]
MKKFFMMALAAICTILAFNSCETLDPDKDFSGTIYGFWVVDKLDVDASVTVNGTTTSNKTTTDFTNEYCRLNLDTSNIATLWFNAEWPDMETFTYNESTKQIEFKKGLDKGDNGKAIVLLGIYDVTLNGDNLILSQPEASIGIGGYGVSERATYYLHRAPKSEKPKETNE